MEREPRREPGHGMISICVTLADGESFYLPVSAVSLTGGETPVPAGYATLLALAGAQDVIQGLSIIVAYARVVDCLTRVCWLWRGDAP